MYAFTDAAVNWLLQKIKMAAPRKYINIQVPVSAWVWDGEKYAAAIEIQGATANDVPLATFAEEDTPNFYAVCATGNGTVTIYADDIPDSVITIQSVIIM